MRRWLRELIEVLRCAALAGAPGPAAGFARKGAADTVRSFQLTVSPLIEETLSDETHRAHVHNALLFCSVKTSYVLSSYSRMIGAPFRADLVVLAGSFARLYDDLIDDIGGVDLDKRLADLFRGLQFIATNDTERLLQRLHEAIDTSLDRPRSDPIYQTLQSLHEYQINSRRQAQPAIGSADLGRITAGKGGLANAALCMLLRPSMSRSEQEIARYLGELLQLLDDCTDVAVDRRHGITTLVSRDEADLATVGAQLRGLRPVLSKYYGRHRARQFVTTLYFLLTAVYLKRYCHRSTAALAPPSSAARQWHPLWILLRRGDNVRPEPAAEAAAEPVVIHRPTAESDLSGPTRVVS